MEMIKKHLMDLGLTAEQAKKAVLQRKDSINQDMEYGGMSPLEIANHIWGELVNPF